MAMSLKDIEKLMKKKKLKYFVHPDNPVLMFNAAGLFGTYQFLLVLEEGGKFLQFRTAGYLSCAPDSPHLREVLKVLGTINHRIRLAKFGWNPNNGEIVVFADVWLMDGKISREQFERMLDNYLPAADLSFDRIKKTIETGKDPGEKSSTLPQDLEALVKKLKEEKKGKEDTKKKKRVYV